MRPKDWTERDAKRRIVQQELLNQIRHAVSFGVNLVSPRFELVLFWSHRALIWSHRALICDGIGPPSILMNFKNGRRQHLQAHDVDIITKA